MHPRPDGEGSGATPPHGPGTPGDPGVPRDPRPRTPGMRTGHAHDGAARAIAEAALHGPDDDARPARRLPAQPHTEMEERG